MLGLMQYLKRCLSLFALWSSSQHNQKAKTFKLYRKVLHTSIKKIGIYDLNVKLHADVGCNLKINVATSEENAKKQKIESETLDKSPNESVKTTDENKTEQDNESVVTKTVDVISDETSKDKKASKDPEKVNSKTNEAKKVEKIKNPESKAT